jgi:hypothetical protein
VVKRMYSDEEKASALAALAANGGNALLTAQQTGVPRTTLRKWAGGSWMTRPQSGLWTRFRTKRGRTGRYLWPGVRTHRSLLRAGWPGRAFDPRGLPGLPGSAPCAPAFGGSV